ncbi:hypothetical protein B0A75_15970 [Flavobacterium oncorhynchi]|uniref:Glycosyltransferase 2-like domain-containing protein n=1 Tax=Flavobacterium oncorhynchi TaxID=728056 RepID=A0A226HU61_9FLAO|nr:hypothetical protein [Flavobacterium oncorhynchi]OXA97458.1 hypothetical protein B0A75_15970 [Flavobacterium oncorhynchi]
MIKGFKNIILVVLYNENITSSITISSLIKNDCLENDFYLVIWDNSFEVIAEDELNILKRKNIQYDYIHKKENTSLSRIYNQIINCYCQIVSKIFIFDQDTIVDKEYFNLIEKAAFQNDDIGLFLPYVEKNGKVISPSKFKIAVNYSFFDREFKFGRTKAKKGIAFGSGMCLKTEIFKNRNLKFDENLSFYGVDYKFVLDYGELHNYFYIIDYELKHDLSFMNEEDVSIKIKRYKSNSYAWLYILFIRLNFIFQFIGISRLFLDTIKLSIKYKNFEFLKIFAHNLKFLVNNFSKINKTNSF